MSDDLVRRLRCYADIDDAVYNPWVYGEAADRIEKLNEDVGVLIAASIRLSSRIDLDSDGYVDRIEKLEAALRTVKEWHGYGLPPETTRMIDAALEGKDD